jgi:septum formation protein
VRLILASASPRRAELLRAAGFEFDVVVADVDEAVRLGEVPAAYVRRLAAEKSAAVGRGFPPRQGGSAASAPEALPPSLKLRRTAVALAEAGRRASPELDGSANERRIERAAPQTPIILGADTTVVVDGEILGKPRDDDEVAAMLRKLSGKRHNVLTGISLRQGAYEVGRVETTEVAFRELSEEEVEWYVASGEGRDKAGAYAIQGRAARFIPRIDGSYSNVVGLPIAAVAELMRSLLASRL